ncbi:MAG: glycosyltransferase family 39 protein [Myxococcota bacterium]|nr:glycosyltransferase family 39 protein [Myxococcota bacterium]
MNSQSSPPPETLNEVRHPPIWRRTWFLCSIIFFSALSLRMADQSYFTDQKRYRDRCAQDAFWATTSYWINDSKVYAYIGQNVYHGHPYSATPDHLPQSGRKGKPRAFEPAATRSPGYPWFIAGVHALTAEDSRTTAGWWCNRTKVIMAQIVLDSANCVLLFWIVSMLFTRSPFPAFFAGLFAASSPFLIFYSKAFLKESLTAFFLTLGVGLFILAMKRRKLRYWTLPGIAFGLMALTSPQFFLLPPFLVGCVLLFWRREQWIKKMCIMMLMFAASILPWTIRNAVVFGEFIPLGVGGVGVSLFWGAHEHWDNWRGWRKFPTFMFKSTKEEKKFNKAYKQYCDYHYASSIKIRKPEKKIRATALEYIRMNPARVFVNWILNQPRLWFLVPHTKMSIAVASQWFFLVTIPFMIAGVVFLWRRELIYALPILGTFAYTNALFFPLHVQPRYGVPVIPVLLALAGIGLYAAFYWATRRRGDLAQDTVEATV